MYRPPDAWLFYQSLIWTFNVQLLATDGVYGLEFLIVSLPVYEIYAYLISLKTITFFHGPFWKKNVYMNIYDII